MAQIFFLRWVNNEVKRWGNKEEEPSLCQSLYRIPEKSNLLSFTPTTPTPTTSRAASKFERSKQSDWNSGNYKAMISAYRSEEKRKFLRKGSCEWQLAQRKMGFRVKVIWNLIVITFPNSVILVNKIVFYKMCKRTQTLQVKNPIAITSTYFISVVFIDKGKIIFLLVFQTLWQKTSLRHISFTEMVHPKV